MEDRESMTKKKRLKRGNEEDKNAEMPQERVGEGK